MNAALAHISTQVTAEEHAAVLEKMRTLVSTPASPLPRQEELYLEQQLTDMLGFEVVSELEGHRLAQTVGVMAALPHLRRHPTDSLEQHASYQEAGLSEKRGGFSWFTEMGQLTDLAIQREKYYFAAQINFLPNWHDSYQDIKTWFKYRKMIVINPHEERAVVGSIGDIGPADWQQYQFGGSPEVIREGLIWSLKSRGHVFFFFIQDVNDTIPLGPISLKPHQLGL